MNEALVRTLKTKHRGPENAVSGRLLQEDFGVTPQQLREWVHDLREDGHPICGTPTEGYYYPRNWEDASHTIAYLTDMAAKFHVTKNNIIRSLEREYGEPTLW